MPNGRNCRRQLAPILAIATAATLAELVLGKSGAAAGGERTIVAESRFDVTNPLCVPKIRSCNIGDEGRQGQAGM